MEESTGPAYAHTPSARTTTANPSNSTPTARWVTRFNRDRLHTELGYLTPIEVKREYVHRQGLLRQAA